MKSQIKKTLNTLFNPSYSEELIKMMINSIGYGVISVNLLIPIIIAFLVVDYFPRNIILFWLVSHITILFLRVLIGRKLQYFIHHQDHIKIKNYLNYYFVIIGFSGCLWGVAGYFIVLNTTDSLVFFTFSVLLGMTAASIATLGSVYHAFLIFILTTLSPFFIAVIYHGGLIFLITGLLIVVFIIILSSAAYQHYKQMKHSIDLNHELILAKKEAEIARERANIANKSKSDFLSNMSHELRTPMHGILGYATMGLKRVESLTPEKNSRYYGNIKTSAERLLTLLNDLLDLAKLESGKMDINYSQSSLETIAVSCVLEQKARLNELNQEIIYMPDNISGEGEFDDVRIGQVITNFLSNAIKFTPKGEKIEFFISHTEIENDDSEKIPALLFSMRDHGNGIPEGEHKLVFDKFTQSSDTLVSSTKGTGLGLPICKEIIELHHGKIWAENHLEGGAVFSFVIPVEQVKIEHPRRRKDD